ncbi:hypothetical protein CLV33_103338 [Jejuia pallidilutea]|uniref:Uncharacterized protein n=1 Tax=Jejuia pallidilutea TaxID=504487 RepID=A0A362X511_9FLAO|nr:hypothetical protein CLV33_103338 [Jejuia pallidilutea]
MKMKNRIEFKLEFLGIDVKAKIPLKGLIQIVSLFKISKMFEWIKNLFD